jgi:hypothetical protein
LFILPIDKLAGLWYNGNFAPGRRERRAKSHPFRSGSVLGFVPSTASALLPFTALGLVALGGVVVATLSATACTEELGAEIIVAHITRAIRGIAETHRRITIHHFLLPHLFCSLYLYYSIALFVCQVFFFIFLQKKLLPTVED